MTVRAVLFDLYGTLIDLERSVFQRRIPGRIGATRRDWTAFVRRTLLVTDFADREAFVDRAIEEFEPRQSDSLREASLALLEEEIDSARRFPGVSLLLPFLRRRGLRLGLLSNLASPYREPCDSLGLREHFDALAFSCERGRAKPDPEIYLDLCRELEVTPEEVLFVGDSLRNDVMVPRELGMRSLRVANHGGGGSTPVAALGFVAFDGECEPLLAPGRSLRLGESSVVIESLEPVPDELHGRYNLVARAEVTADDGRRHRVYLKRYLAPESAHVEAFANVLLREVGLETPADGVVAGPEPLYWSREAPGEKVEELDLTPELAFDIGRHGASAYLFSNADLRPRNAFLVEERGPRLVMIDHEHCLFNLALDTTGVSRPRDPHAIDALGGEELGERARRRVLSARAMRRTYRSFFGERGTERRLSDAFREGWTDLHRTAQRRRASLETLLRDRIYSEPYLIIGTRGYRRSLAKLDIEDLLGRVDLEPADVLDSWME